MIALKFKCTLLSDVILSSRFASEGPNRTLDYIPGACFLGIVAGKVYKECKENAMELLHSGRVRYGDAHPSLGDFRSNKVPASMFSPKLKSPEDNLYVFHGIKYHEALKPLQLKQRRDGFYNFSTSDALRVQTTMNYAIKSAYDRSTRSSKEGQLFAYESLEKGLVLYFTVEVDNDEYVSLVRSSLVGKKHVGRSRTAQYGLVDIEEYDYREIESKKNQDDQVSVYVDSRLICLDEAGNPHWEVTASDLGIEDPQAEVLWEKSQVRFFRYTPWNFKRNAPDADRCGIEKGSVLIVRTSQPLSTSSRYVGSYKNEGFGRVIYNPAFLAYDAEGKSEYNLIDSNAAEIFDKKQHTLTGTPLLKYLSQRVEQEAMSRAVYELVNKKVQEWGSLFKGDSFASQWGAIRNKAMCAAGKEDLISDVRKYLSHGVAEIKWAANGRRERLIEFMENLDDRCYKEAVVNLASEMAKECKNK